MIPLQKIKKYPVLGIDISSYSKHEFFEAIETRLSDPDPATPPLFVVTVNPEIIIESIVDSEFKDILKQSGVNTADGVGVSWAVRFIYRQNVERITGSDSVEEICKLCSRLSQKVYFFGAAPGVASRAAEILQERIDGLLVAGTYSPAARDIPFDDLPVDVQKSLASSSVVFVALGAPAQEKWIHKNLGKLSCCKFIVGIGGSFDFIAGQVKRAPVAFQKSGLEWAYRLWLQPSRWKRMVKLPLFALNVMLLKSSMNGMKNAPH